MDKKKIKIEIELEQWEITILQLYGYDIPKNVQENLKLDAYYIFIANQNDEEDIGTATVNEMRKQNGDF